MLIKNVNKYNLFRLNSLFNNIGNNPKKLITFLKIFYLMNMKIFYSRLHLFIF